MEPGRPAHSLDVPAAQAALGRAYAGLAERHDDETMLQESITLLESALDAGSRALSATETAVVEQALGTALWSLGERRASARLLEDAARAKLNALELLETAGDTAAANRLREDLDDLGEAIARLAEGGARTSKRAS